jgi:hypothetical protein
MSDEATPTEHLRALARRIAAPYAALPACRAIILTGSAAEGLADRYSDLDVILYYDELPSEEELRTAREGLGERTWHVDDRADGAVMEAFPVRGVECQCGHTTVARWERDVAEVLERHTVDTPLHKAMDGMLHAEPLYGEQLVREWQARLATFPPGLAEAMVRRYLSFFPLWALGERLATRDAALWVAQSLAESAFNLLGVAAGLSGRYFTPFQLKRVRRFAEGLRVAPERLAERAESLVLGSQAEAARELAALVDETTTLVERHMPQVDTARVRRQLARRDEPWALGEG